MHCLVTHGHIHDGNRVKLDLKSRQKNNLFQLCISLTKLRAKVHCQLMSLSHSRLWRDPYFSVGIHPDAWTRAESLRQTKMLKLKSLNLQVKREHF